MLTEAQKALILEAGHQLTEYDAISVKYREFEMPDEQWDGLVFTSKNGVQSFINTLPSDHPYRKVPVFCVGDKTSAALETAGFKVMVQTSNAAELAAVLANKYNNWSFLYIAGNRSREVLPNTLKEASISFTKLVTYDTLLTPKKIESDFNDVLFFSPSGVTSFFENNQLKGTGICIGATTAGALKEYTDAYIIAKKPTVEHVIAEAVKRY